MCIAEPSPPPRMTTTFPLNQQPEDACLRAGPVPLKCENRIDIACRTRELKLTLGAAGGLRVCCTQTGTQ